ncbi:amino acid adenylation domain-containing protein [Oxalobacteraceae bacterium GrIS 1.11]
MRSIESNGSSLVDGHGVAVQTAGNVLALFESQAERQAASIAVQYEKQQLSYGELNRQADGLSALLAQRGVAPGSRVAICLAPGLLTAIAVLGVLKAGCAYIPLAPADPVQRIGYMLDDSGACALLTEQDHLPKLAGLGPAAIALDQLLPTLDKLAGRAVRHALAPQQLAYILYTSGSTGQPKGVMVAHASLAYYLDWHCHGLRPEIGQVDLPLSSSLCFAAAVTQFYTPLLLGRTLHVLSREVTRQADRLFAWYRQHPQFGLYCVPTLWSELLKHAEAQRAAGLVPVGPRCLLLSGEAASNNLLWRTLALWPQLPVWNLFGPTEATANASFGQLRPGAPITIGKPIAGTAIFLVDEAMRLVAPGQTGELCICGPGLATGYVNLAELSRQRFVPNPYSQDCGARLFKTGDLAKTNEQGDLVFIGRRDFQVKIRGFRVECGDVEAALGDYAPIRQAVVVCRADEGAEHTLVAYVTLHAGRQASADQIRSHLVRRLPEYMVPAAFVVLEAFPALANGKLDRSRLPAPGRCRPNLAYARTPADSVEQGQLLRVWEEVLRLEGLGIDDDFFDLGGDSLKVAAARARIEALLHVSVPYRDFFDHPTPARLSRWLMGAGRPRPLAPPAIASPQLESGSAEPCSERQASLWFLAQTYPALSAYNMRFSLRMRGELDCEALRASVAAIVQGQPALRTVFGQENAYPSYTILPAAAPLIAEVDLRALSEDAGERQFENLAGADCRRAFELERGPACRFTLYRLSGQRHILSVVVHHIVFDGQSIGIFCREFIAYYRALRAGRPLLVSAPARPAQQLPAPEQDASLRFWQQQLKDAPQTLDLATDYQRPAARGFHGAVKFAYIDESLKRRVIALGREQGATPFMTLFALFNLLLFRHSGQADILLGCPVACRGQAQDAIGFFVNTIVLRTRLEQDDSFHALLARVRDSALSCFEHQALSFEKLLESLRPERSLNRTPLFQAMFSFHDKLFQGQIDSQLALQVREDGNAGAKYGLLLEVQDQDEGLELRLTYDSDLYAASTATQLLEQFIHLLGGVVDDAHSKLGEYNLLPDAHRRQIAQWNANAVAVEPCTVARLFDIQAAATPGQAALIGWDDSMSYGALARRANQLARHLASRGVRSGMTVGVHLDASAAMVIALLAILKAGATYVPLDPYYPLDRIDDIIEDSGLRHIVTQRDYAGRLGGVDLIVLDAEAEAIGAQAPEPLDLGEDDPQRLMYLMYTSGSTGRPKGVMVHHDGVCNYLLWMKRRFPFGPEDRVLAKTSINFDISVWEIFLPLICGAQLVIGRRAQLQAPEALGRLIVEQAISIIQFVPSALRAFVDAGQLPACASLRRIFCGGEALSVDLQDEVLNGFSGEMHNLYGPTEASIYVCHWECRRGERLRSVPIGRPIDNCAMHILDTQMRPVALGVPGEAYIGGANVAKGYRQRAELSAHSFVADPFSSDPQARLFKTGDIARYWSDGAIEFLGRADRQVKVRGYRIELDEIEHHIGRHPDVSRAIVQVREDKPGDVRLVAYLLYRDKQVPTTAALREYLKRKLPDYMIPSTFVALESIPLLPNNKTDFKALPKPPYQIVLDAARSYDNQIERVLAGIWEEVLGGNQFGPEDSFFEVGGHSLLIAVLRKHIAQRLEIEVSNIDLFQYPSIGALARHLLGRAQGKVVAALAHRATLRNRRGLAVRRPPQKQITNNK